ncbi:MAG TPA: bifunctional hydroxymethylpyrimidine kinase/phosphomethylpyrimidine kinase [Gemmatimonadaceae bacterium]|nr:bifunctional hydroxymethylpyrimidine kinase/phosphomethylpyrimidine kinase [Gemmatimonadaceae bacterium]
MQIALTIAGSDSGGGAGIQADLKTFHQFGVFGTSVVTAITAQNTRRVESWEPVSAGMVRAQLDAVVTDLAPAAVKSGMLGARDIVLAVAAGIAEHKLAWYVLDPVMVATSGDVLLEPDAVSAVRDRLMPLAALVTPNLHEAALLLERQITGVREMTDAAERLVRELGARAALVKGGHLTGPTVIDVLYVDGSSILIRNPRIDTTSTHGTGCTLSAAITAGLALGGDLEDTVRSAIRFVHRAIRTAPELGSGSGPLNHFAPPG